MIFINGQPVSDEQFAQMQEQFEQKQEQLYQQLIDTYHDYKAQYDCNNAIVPFPFDVHQRPHVICSLDNKQINISICNSCKAKNIEDYTNL